MVLLQLFQFSASFMLLTVMLQMPFYPLFFLNTFIVLFIFCVVGVVVVADDVVENFQTLHDDNFPLHVTLSC